MPGEKLISTGFDHRFPGAIGQDKLDDYMAASVAEVSSLEVDKVVKSLLLGEFTVFSPGL